MGDEELEVVVAEDVVLRQPLGQQHVRRQPLHRLSLPLPDDALLQAAKNFQEGLMAAGTLAGKLAERMFKPYQKDHVKFLSI